jgi:hypothetical protein
MLNELEFIKLARSTLRRSPKEILEDLKYSGKLWTPIQRRNVFMKELTEARKRKEEWSFRGFILPVPRGFQKKHPTEPYLLLSPLRVEEQMGLKPSDRVYLLLKIPPETEIPEGVKINDYVEVRGFIDGIETLPDGTGGYKRVDVLRTTKIMKLEVEDYWTSLEGCILSQREVLNLFEEVFLSEQNFVKSIIYGLLGSPYILEYRLPEGFSLGVFQEDERVISEFLRAFNQFAGIFPKEFLLSYRMPSANVEEPLFGLYYGVRLPTANYEYYFNKNKVVISEEIPLPEWVRPYLFQHRHSIYSPKLSPARLDDSFAVKSEVFWAIRDRGDFEFQIHRELKDLSTNLLATFLKLKSEVKTIRTTDEVPNVFRAVLGRLLRSYGYEDIIYRSEIIRSRYRLGLTLWGASYRFEKDKEKALREFKVAVEEMLERWILSLPEKELRNVNPYKGVSVDKVIKVLKELETVYPDGVPVRVLIDELSLRGYNNPEVLIEKLLAEGFVYSPSGGRVKSI